MAIGDIGMFLPSESHYKTPGAYDALLSAEARKVADYLSQMDQFYENLEESKRQFSETLGFKVETRGLELAFAEKRLGAETELARESLAGERAYRSSLIELQQRELGLKGQELGMKGGYQAGILDLARKDAASLAAARAAGTSYLAGRGAEGTMPTGSAEVTPSRGAGTRSYYQSPWVGSGSGILRGLGTQDIGQGSRSFSNIPGEPGYDDYRRIIGEDKTYD